MQLRPRIGPCRTRSGEVWVVIIGLALALSQWPGRASDGKSPAEDSKRSEPTLETAFDRLENDLKQVNLKAFRPSVLASALGPDVGRIFTLVRDNIGFHAYSGALRGARGTLVSGAGNSVDKSLLLATLLTHNKFEVRFASGSLSDELIQQLVKESAACLRDNSALEAAGFTGGKCDGELDIEAVLRNVERDSAIIDELLRRDSANVESNQSVLDELQRDLKHHVWVQCRQDGEWIDLDPSFRSAKVGERFAQLSHHHPSIPDNLYQQVTIRVRAAHQTGGKTKTVTLLEVSKAASELAGRPIFLVNIPRAGRSTELSDWLNQADAFMPILYIAGEAKKDKAINLNGNTLSADTFEKSKSEDLVSSGANRIAGKLDGLFGETKAVPITKLIGEWLEFELSFPNGQKKQFVREIAGIAPPFLDQKATFETTAFVSEERMRDKLTTRIDISIQTGISNEAFVRYKLEAQTAARRNLLAELVRNDGKASDGAMAGLVETEVMQLSVPLIAFELMRDRLGRRWIDQADPSMGYYLSSPSITLFRTHWDRTREGERRVSIGFDIVERQVATATDDGKVRRDWARALGLIDTHLERVLALQLAPIFAADIQARWSMASPLQAGVTSTVDFLDLARQRNIDLTVLSPTDESTFDCGEIPRLACLRLKNELRSGFTVILPSKVVTVESSPRLAWWRIDPRSGYALGVTDTGQGQGLVDTIITLDEVILRAIPRAVALSTFYYGLGCAAAKAVCMVMSLAGFLVDQPEGAEVAVDATCTFIDIACPWIPKVDRRERAVEEHTHNSSDRSRPGGARDNRRQRGKDARPTNDPPKAQNPSEMIDRWKDPRDAIPGGQAYLEGWTLIDEPLDLAVSNRLGKPWRRMELRYRKSNGEEVVKHGDYNPDEGVWNYIHDPTGE